MSFDGGVTETEFALGQMPEMSALNCSDHLEEFAGDYFRVPPPGPSLNERAI
jgi:hypothetical protein